MNSPATLQPRAGQTWERIDGNHQGTQILITRVGPYSVKMRYVGKLKTAPNGGNERQRNQRVPLDELQRHYTLRKDIRSVPAIRQEEMFTVVTAPADAAKAESLDDVWEKLRNGKVQPHQREALIAKIRRLGIPREGTPERALYMQLFRGRPPDEYRDKLVARLYSDSDVPVTEILRVLRLDANGIARVRRRLDLPTREDMHPWRPSAHMLDTEELVVDDGEAMFRHQSTGLMRPAWEGPEPEPEPAPEAEPQPEPEPVPVARRPRKSLSAAQEAEVVRLYTDQNVKVQEIREAYDLTPGGMYSILKRHNIPPVHRTNDPRPAVGEPLSNVGVAVHYREHPGSPDLHQLHLGQADGAAIQEPRQLAVHGAVIQEREWSIHYVVTRVALVSGPSVDEALRRARERLGEDIDVVRVERS